MAKIKFKSSRKPPLKLSTPKEAASPPEITQEDSFVPSFTDLPTTGNPAKKLLIQCTRQHGLQKLEIITKEQVSFGRDNQKSDIELLIEPVLPLDQFPENVQKSMRISSVHFLLKVDESSPKLMDAKSSNGTLHNTQRLPPLQFVSLKDEDIVEIAGVLQLQAHIIASKTRPSILFSRLNNAQNKHHLVLGHAIGIWPQAEMLVGPVHSLQDGWAPLQLQEKNGHLYLANVSVNDLRVDTTKVAPGQAIPFGQSIGSIEFDGCFWGWQGS